MSMAFFSPVIGGFCATYFVEKWFKHADIKAVISGFSPLMFYFYIVLRVPALFDP